MPKDQVSRAESVIHSIGDLPSLAGLKLKAIMEALQHDKKVRDGAVHFVLPIEIGKVEITSAVPLELVRDTVKALVDENKVRR
jgi:3-dehydroquinate synthase